jgi:hypothetical protein
VAVEEDAHDRRRTTGWTNSGAAWAVTFNEQRDGDERPQRIADRAGDSPSSVAPAAVRRTATRPPAEVPEPLLPSGADRWPSRASRSGVGVHHHALG